MVVMQILILLTSLFSVVVNIGIYRILTDIKNIKIYSKEIYDREGWL